MLQQKIAELLARLPVVEEELSTIAPARDPKRYKELTQDHAYLSDVRTHWEQVQRLTAQRNDNTAMLKGENDPDLLALLSEDNALIDQQLATAAHQLQTLLVPPDPHDHATTILELRAGTGGQEAALFVADCVRMYQLYAAHMGWKVEPLSATESDLDGFKEYIMELSGHNVHRYLQYEGGTHRVQRVPATEAQGRIHTSTITMAVLLEPEACDVSLNPADLRMETTRASGAGGQHVNKTDSAVRITHMPTGIAVFCQEERSQQRNREKAMRYLSAKIAALEAEKVKAAADATRSAQIGGAERAEKIRTYNYPQNRLTDHRINFTSHNLTGIMNGDLQELNEALITHFQGALAL